MNRRRERSRQRKKKEKKKSAEHKLASRHSSTSPDNRGEGINEYSAHGGAAARVSYRGRKRRLPPKVRLKMEISLCFLLTSSNEPYLSTVPLPHRLDWPPQREVTHLLPSSVQPKERKQRGGAFSFKCGRAVWFCATGTVWGSWRVIIQQYRLQNQDWIGTKSIG